MPDLQEFRSFLAAILVRELELWRPIFSAETMRAFDLGCFPWHGYLELSFLTASEPQLRPEQSPYESMAEWRWYNFVPEWPSAKELSSEMQRCWTLAADKKDLTNRYLIACAAAVNSSEVSSALAAYNRSADFEVRVVNHDNPKSVNYCHQSRAK